LNNANPATGGHLQAFILRTASGAGTYEFFFIRFDLLQRSNQPKKARLSCNTFDSWLDGCMLKLRGIFGNLSLLDTAKHSPFSFHTDYKSQGKKAHER
jgi:hypothetical protein